MTIPGCTLTVDELSSLGLGHRITLYAAIKADTFPLTPIRVGRKILFPRSRVADLLDLTPAELDDYLASRQVASYRNDIPHPNRDGVEP